MIKRLYFVRHGESEHHVNGMTGGWTDLSLTPRGIAQAEAAGDYLATQAPGKAALYTSDLKRAAETAVIIGKRLGLEAIALPGLREINNGDAANKTEIAARALASAAPATSALHWRQYPNAETFAEMARRITATLVQLPGGFESVVVVGHGLSGQALGVAWLGLAVGSISLTFAPASVSLFQVNAWGEREITFLNRIPY